MLTRYEHIQLDPDNPALHSTLVNTATAKLQADDQRQRRTLRSLICRAFRTLQQLRGKVVLVNFRATWCSPCRKELPHLGALYKEFGKQCLVILALLDEEEGKVKRFLEEKKVSYTVLLDPGSKARKEFAVEGIPRALCLPGWQAGLSHWTE
jgi:peroxiredoxin